MGFIFWLFAGISACFAIKACSEFFDDWGGDWGWWMVGSLVFAFMAWLFSPSMVAWRNESAAKQAAQNEYWRTPHVTKRFDDCEVYQWREGDGDHWHYITRCKTGQVTTESSRTVTCGKNCHKTVTETIKTEDQK